MININNKLLKKAVDKWGKDAQVIMIIEEMSELTKEICKNERGRDNHDQIVEELTDVLIMLEQGKYIYNIDDNEIEYYFNLKMKYLEDKLKG